MSKNNLPMACAQALLSAALMVFQLPALALTERISVDSQGIEGNSGSEAASISADGRLVVFASRASNLVSGDTNGKEDVFVHD